jgi:energy-converting hydrogenase Eha subunit B
MISVLGLGLPELLLIAVIAVVAVLPASRICAKAGYPAWLGALAILPVANVVLAFFLAFSRWPIERQVEALQQDRR